MALITPCADLGIVSMQSARGVCAASTVMEHGKGEGRKGRPMTMRRRISSRLWQWRSNKEKKRASTESTNEWGYGLQSSSVKLSLQYCILGLGLEIVSDIMCKIMNSHFCEWGFVKEEAQKWRRETHSTFDTIICVAIPKRTRKMAVVCSRLCVTLAQIVLHFCFGPCWSSRPTATNDRWPFGMRTNELLVAGDRRPTRTTAKVL